MAEKLISVRMPASLVKELRDLVRINHYIDFSEQLRSIIRNELLRYEKLNKDFDSKRREELLNELRKVLLGEVDE